MDSPFLARPESEHLASNELAFAIFDLYPVSEGHVLVIPRRRIATWFDATKDEQHALFALVDEVKRLLDVRFRPDGYNVGFNAGEAAGQTVPHLHVHVIPRYRGDMDDPRGGVRHVIPSKGNYRREDRPLVSGGVRDPLAAHVLPLLERSTCISILAAFVQESGVRRIRDSLELALQRGASVRLLTGDYLNITQASALEAIVDWMGSWPAVESDQEVARGVFEARVVEVEKLAVASRSFHPKAWHFEGPELGIAFVGSSNLSLSALDAGIEWNLRVDRDRDRKAWEQVRSEYDTLWAGARPIDAEWVESYANRARLQSHALPEGEVEGEPLPDLPEPHDVQRRALDALMESRRRGYARAMVVLATGLGKTWLAAFDWKREWEKRGHAPRLLFLAHRREILLQAMEVFRLVVRHRDEPLRVGWFVGPESDMHADLVFASVAKMSRRDWLEKLARTSFDYVVVDEVHHAAADSYRRILAALDQGGAEGDGSRFLLGLTATPDRADSSDVVGLFSDNIAFRAGVPEGISIQRLVPFHYFGLKDDTDYASQNIPWRNGRFDPEALSNAVQTDRRMQSLWSAWEAHPGKRTLVFCCSVAHVDFAAKWLAAQGVLVAKVYSEPGSDDREKSLRALASGEIDAICAVDVFNEGVDVPLIDRVVMLRPTESGVVFLQQLGRGLRKAPGKDFLTVLDFVGNHRVFLDRMRTLVSLAARDPSDRVASLVETGRADLPQGCSVELEIEAKHLLEALFKVGEADDVERAYRRFELEKGRRPLAGEIYRMGYLVSALRERHGSWFHWVVEASGLREGERSAYDRASRFLEGIEFRESMSRSFKMVTLQALLEADALGASVPVRDVALWSWRILKNDPELLADVPADMRLLEQPDEAAVAKWVRYWTDNPIAAWSRGARGRDPWFRTQGNRFECSVPVDEALKGLVRELVDYRLATYRTRTHGRSDGSFVCKVTWNQRDPILKLPDRSKHQVPEGNVNVRLPDGATWLFRFKQEFVNVAVPAGAKRNQLPDLLRSWFGVRVGMPGTAFQVAFRSDVEGLRACPFEAKPVQPADGMCQLIAYDDLQAVAGLTRPVATGGVGRKVLLPFDGDPTDAIAMRVTGNSMDGGDDPIREGDWAVFRLCRGASPDSLENRVVLLQVTQGADPALFQIKRIQRRGTGWILASDNPQVTQIEATGEVVPIAKLEAVVPSDKVKELSDEE